METYWPIWMPVPKQPWIVMILETGKRVRNKEGKAYTFSTSDAAFAFIEKLERKEKTR